jgi:predicted ArsR family transcriptional regulator
MGRDRDEAQDRVTIQEAARRLGIKEDAVRKRIQRDSIRHEKTAEGRVFVWVDAAQDAAEDTYQDVTLDALLAAKDETIAALREQLEEANTRDREQRRIIAGLTQRIPAIEAPTEAPGPSEAATAGEGKGDVSHDPQTGARRPWWRRMFGR